jgi:hypothetical protein
MGKWFEYCESALGLLAAFMLGIAVPPGLFFAGLGRIHQGFWVQGLGVLAISALSLRSSVIVIRLAARWEKDVLKTPVVVDEDEYYRMSFDFEEGIPEADRRALIGFMASNLPELTWRFRLWCSLFWLALLATATYLGHQLCLGAIHAANNDGNFLFFLACVGHLAFLVAANLYLVLAVAVLTPKTHEWLFFYRSRLLLDVVAISVSVGLVLAV